MENYIEFPNLGLKFPINPGIEITENYSIKWYGIIICFAFILCVLLALRSCERYGLSKDNLLDYILITVPCAIIGARVYYVIFSWDSYRENWTDIFKIWEGGLAIYGGVIAVVITVLIVSKIKKQSFIQILDFALPYIILGQAIGRWGNFVNQEAYGSSTTLPWGMTGNLIALDFGSSLVHPTFLYESLWCFAAFAAMMFLRRRLHQKGQMTCLYMIFYGAERALVEGLRTDSLMLGPIRVSQWLSAILCAAGIVLFICLTRRHKAALDAEAVTEDNSISRLARTLEAQSRQSGSDSAEEAEGVETGDRKAAHEEQSDLRNTEEQDER